MCVLYRQPPGPCMACSGTRGFQVVSEQLQSGRHAQTCHGIFGIAEGSTDTQTLLRAPHTHIHIFP